MGFVLGPWNCAGVLNGSTSSPIKAHYACDVHVYLQGRMCSSMYAAVCLPASAAPTAAASCPKGMGPELCRKLTAD